MTKTNSELLKISTPSVLGGLDKQRRFVLQQLIRPMPCPNCATPQSYVQAAGLTVDTIDTDKASDDPCSCIACRRGLKYTVQMIGGPCWSLVPITLPATAS